MVSRLATERSWWITPGEKNAPAVELHSWWTKATGCPSGARSPGALTPGTVGKDDRWAEDLYLWKQCIVFWRQRVSSPRQPISCCRHPMSSTTKHILCMKCGKQTLPILKSRAGDGIIWAPSWTITAVLSFTGSSVKPWQLLMWKDPLKKHWTLPDFRTVNGQSFYLITAPVRSQQSWKLIWKQRKLHLSMEGSDIHKHKARSNAITVAWKMSSNQTTIIVPKSSLKHSPFLLTTITMNATIGRNIHATTNH